MGVGKTAVCKRLNEILPNSVFLDGDWCWYADPFTVTEETKKMVLENICFLLNQFLDCICYENILFCWVMHEQGIIDDILHRIKKDNCEIKTISLICEAQTLRERLEKDILSGSREGDIIGRSIARLPLYDCLDTIKIITDSRSIESIAGEIAEL